MKSLFAAALLLGSLNATAATTKLQVCRGVSDPDFANAYLYKVDDKFVVTINVEYGDGDFFATDTIEVQKIEDGNDSMQTFVQVEGSYPAPPEQETEPGDEYQPTRKTKHVQLSIPYLPGEGHMITQDGPHGDELEEVFECKPPRKR